jgi:flavin reductase (DIM6/NTAB) family NADH-FMN oxidoreductase RutF
MNDQMRPDPAAKKQVLRMFTYGLYAVGVASGAEQAMFTANWVTQVSFDPPLIALSVENDSHSIGLLRAGGQFAISVFLSTARDQAGILGRHYRNHPNKMEQVRHRSGMTGCPILEDALGVVECRVVGELPAGDSTVFIGEIISAGVQHDGRPLTMAEAGFRHSG